MYLPSIFKGTSDVLAKFNKRVLKCLNFSTISDTVYSSLFSLSFSFSISNLFICSYYQNNLNIIIN